MSPDPALDLPKNLPPCIYYKPFHEFCQEYWKEKINFFHIFQKKFDFQKKTDIVFFFIEHRKDLR